MAKTLTRSSHWRPARWGAPRMGAALSWKSVTVPVDMLVGAAGGVLGGLIVGKPVGDLLNVSPPMATGILAVMAVAAPLMVKQMPNSAKNVLLGVGAGLGAATVLRLIQPLFATP